MTSVEKILKKNGPVISSELARKLAEKEGIKVNTASQQIARSKAVLRIGSFFRSNQSLVYLKEHVENGDVFPKLLEAMFSHGLKYWYAINALKVHDGMISQIFFESYTNYPIKPLKSHFPFSKVMQMFVTENILVYNDDEFILSPKFHNLPIGGLFSKSITNIKLYILENFHTLLKNTGIISYNTGDILAEYGKYRWGFKGVCPVVGLKNDGKFGFVLADILIGKPIYKEDVLFFVAKIKQVLSFKRAPRLMPFLIVDDLDKEALNYLKENGIVVGFIKDLFGSKYAENLKELIAIFNNAGASLKDNPNKYLELIEELRKYNHGLLNNIRGTLFEYVVAHIHLGYGCRNLELGWEIIDSNGRHEMDVMAIYNDYVVISECKGTKAPTDVEKVDRWISKKIPAFRSWFAKQEVYKRKTLKFEYWSTGGFTIDAKTRLDEFVGSYRKNDVSYYDQVEIRKAAKKMNNKKLKEAVDNFFLKTSV